jgi:uncharacterized protein YigA (DUF484 family)
MLSAEAVEEFLLANPEFLYERTELLSQLRLSEASNGNTVSLVQHQAQRLQSQKSELEQRLKSLIGNAKENDVLFEKTRLLVLAMLQSRSANHIASKLKQRLHEQFNVDYVEIFIFNNTVNGEDIVSLDFLDAQDRLGELATNPAALCGSLTKGELNALFGESGQDVGSAAIQPFHYGTFQGLIALGSKDPERYRSSVGTLFLSYVAEVFVRLLALQES